MANFTGTNNDDLITGTSNKDYIDFSQGGGDTIAGGGGEDTLVAGATFGGSDHVNGGAGADTLSLEGDYSSGLTLGADTLRNVEYLYFHGTHSYAVTTHDNTVATGGSLSVHAGFLSAGNSLFFDGSAETNGS